MKVNKIPIDSNRIRTIPAEGFSWIDRRFVRDCFVKLLPRETILLYFFLTLVSDAQGLSFYSDRSMGKLLKLNAEELTQSRSRLVGQDLILYRYPLYQVLPLPTQAKSVDDLSTPTTPSRRGDEGLLSLREFFRHAGFPEPRNFQKPE